MMGMSGMFTQGVLLRIVVARVSEGTALMWAMFMSAIALVGAATTTNETAFAGFLILVTIGYGLTIPNLSALYSYVPLPQGTIQGVAGALDRLGQSCGPLLGLAATAHFSESSVLVITGVEMLVNWLLCLAFLN